MPFNPRLPVTDRGPQERKYFDSGDYALSKAGKASDVGVTSVGSQHPLPENIPHLTSPNAAGGPTGTPPPPGTHGPGGANGGPHNGSVSSATGGGPPSVSPVKESSYLHRQTSADEPSPAAGAAAAAAEPEAEGRRDLNAGRTGSLSPGGEARAVPARWQS